MAQRGRAAAGGGELKTTLVANSDPGGGGASLLGPLGMVLGVDGKRLPAEASLKLHFIVPLQGLRRKRRGVWGEETVPRTLAGEILDRFGELFESLLLYFFSFCFQ